MDNIYSKVPKYECKDCTTRYLGCHDRCESYKAARQFRIDTKITADKQNDCFILTMTKDRWKRKHNIHVPYARIR